jgi:hypothetical protein
VKAHLENLVGFGQGTNRSIGWFFLVWVFQDKSHVMIYVLLL